MRVLVATDGSPCSSAAVAEAGKRPWPADTEIRVLSVAHTAVPMIPDPLFVGYATYLDAVEDARAHAWEAVHHAVGAIRQAAPSVPVSGEVLEGDPKHLILQEAEQWKSDLILVGSHGWGPAKRFLLGSTSLALVLHAPCSVEIIRPQRTTHRHLWDQELSAAEVRDSGLGAVAGGAGMAMMGTVAGAAMAGPPGAIVGGAVGTAIGAALGGGFGMLVEHELAEAGMVESETEPVPEVKRVPEVPPLTVADAMQRSPHTVSPGATLAEARALLNTSRQASLPVIEEGRVVGRITPRELFEAPAQRAEGVREWNVGDVMLPEPHYCHETDPLEPTVRHMLEREASQVLVLDSAGELVGQLSQRDAAAAFERQRLGAAGLSLLRRNPPVEATASPGSARAVTLSECDWQHIEQMARDSGVATDQVIRRLVAPTLAEYARRTGEVAISSTA